MEIRLLGPFEVHRNGVRLELPSGRLRSLLAALAAAPGRAVPVERLVEYLWGREGAPPTARHGLQNLVWRLRQLLGATAVTVDGEAYRLGGEPEAVDLWHFDQELERAANAADPAAQTVALKRALALWRGEPLSGVESELLRQEVAPALTERYLAALERRIDLDLDGGVPDGLVAELYTLISRHPLRESLWLRLLTALAASGRTAEALTAYERLRETLAEQLGTDPSRAVRALHQQILIGATPAAEADAAAVRQTAPVPRQLPTVVAGFVGRAGQLATLDKLLDTYLEQAERRAITAVLHGPGGVGKTALAVRWARGVAHHFPGGQYFIDLRGYGSEPPVPAHHALGVLLRAAGAEPATLPHDTAERAALWRSRVAGQRVLLVFDNAGHVDQVRPLLPGAGSAVVVTSRGQLRGLTVRDGAVSLPVAPLPETEARDLLAGTVGAERVVRQADAVTALTRLCGGLPLALRIIADQAARLPDADLAALAAALRSHRLDVLADPDDPSTDPRTVFSWSYRSLEPDSARAFRLLSLHPGGELSLAAAAALLGEPQPSTRRTLERLLAVHLLERPGPDRYRYHDLLREYAAERAVAESPPEERERVARRMVDWYLQSANQVQRTLRLGAPLEVQPPADAELEPLRFADRPAALAWYQAELPAVMAVGEYAADHGYPSHAYQLPWALHSAFELTGRLQEWLRLAEIGYRAAQSLGARARYLAAHAMGTVHSYLRRPLEEERYKIEALRYARENGDPKGVVSALTGMGVLRGGQELWLAAIEHYQEALDVARANGLDFQAAHCLLNIGSEQMNHGRHAEGIRYTTQALNAYRQLDAVFHQGMALSNLADAYARNGDIDRAVECCDQGAELLQGTDSGVPLAFAIDVAAIYAQAGRPEEARDMVRRAVDMLRGGEHPRLAEARQMLDSLEGFET